MAVQIAPPLGRRLRLRLLAGVLLLLGCLAGATVTGVGWYYSDQVLQVARVAAYDGPPRYAGGRRIPTGDPGAVGLRFEEVSVPGELGPLPAWLVPARDLTPAETWAITVHGRGAHRDEALRVLPTLHAAGLSTLAVSYRNDRDAPASPDGHYSLGDTEWRDVAAAIRFAQERGARSVVLYGWSMGGAIVLETVDRAAEAGLVRALVLDAPVLDWQDVLDAQGAARGLPAPLTRFAQQVVQWRAGIDFDDLDQVAAAGQLRVPVLLFHGTADDFVPVGPSTALAQVRPDLVTYVPVPGAGHVQSWEAAPADYERRLRDFVRSVG